MFNSVEEMRAAFPDSPIEAWADESVRMSADPPMHLLCATVFLSDPYTLLRHLEKVKPKDARKLH